jgi:hypothetical protein
MQGKSKLTIFIKTIELYLLWLYDQRNLSRVIIEDQSLIRLFRIMSIPTTFRLFRVLTSELFGRRLPVFTLLL